MDFYAFGTYLLMKGAKGGVNDNILTDWLNVVDSLIIESRHDQTSSFLTYVNTLDYYEPMIDWLIDWCVEEIVVC